MLDRRCDRERNGGRGEDELGDEHHGVEMGDKPVDGELDQGFSILIAREGVASMVLRSPAARGAGP